MDRNVAWTTGEIPAGQAISLGASVFCEGIKICSAAFSGSSGMEEASADVLRIGSSKPRSMTRSLVITSEIANVSQAIMPVRCAMSLMHSMGPTIW